MSEKKILLKLGVDIGGTFTDVFLTEEISGRYWIGKKLTTHKDPSSGVIGLIKELLKKTGYELSDIFQIIHGTTLISNAIIERKGAKTSLIVTAGFIVILVT